MRYSNTLHNIYSNTIHVVAVLNALKSSWKNLPRKWKGSDPCGRKWEGINCTNSRVTTLILAGIGVTTNGIGDIPSLSMLQYLDLSNNKGIRVILPPSIQNLKNLTTLILVGCSFRGPIPDSIGSLKQLVFLVVNFNPCPMRGFDLCLLGVSLEAASLSSGIEVRLAYISPSPDPTNSLAIGGIILGTVVVVVVKSAKGAHA
ncbi:putative non-specific serine/threonine protein kinase [Helianthus anomalus]